MEKYRKADQQQQRQNIDQAFDKNGRKRSHARNAGGFADGISAEHFAGAQRKDVVAIVADHHRGKQLVQADTGLDGLHEITPTHGAQPKADKHEADRRK